MRKLIRKADGRPVEGAISVAVDVVNEQALILAALADKGAREQLADRLSPDLFSGDRHGLIWNAVVEMRRQGLDYSPEVVQRLTGSEEAALYCERLVGDRRGPPANLRHHVDLLYWDRGRVEAARGPLPLLLKAFQDPTKPPEQVRKLADDFAAALAQRGAFRRYIRDPEALAAEAEAFHGMRVPYGIDGLDDYENGDPRIVLGASPGKITVVTALSGSGKSQFCRALALGQAAMGRRVAYGAWEMGSGTMLALMACSTLGLDRTALVAGTFSPEEKRLHRDEIHRLKSLVRFFDRPMARGERRDNDAVLDDVHGMLLDFGCDVVIFDLWHRGFRFRYPEEEADALDRMQAIADATGVHCVLAAQQRLKDIENRTEPKPTREGNKGSAAWVECADTMFGVHLPHLWKPVPPTIMEILVLKQRYGKWPLAVEADYEETTGNFSNVRSIEVRRAQGSKIDGWIDGGEEEQPKRGGRRRKAA